ncbi:hypothetical protein C1Y40_03915 [Mycobacterium talmoniae]|uniref:Uncharacterized protein n=1 Tax=Mycobacterium talmoniae TaxID=1858794 RepID=A0A2S8BGX5_9MYCO|nr:hypothetical protein C1Y40_03915 [Mycobacterium talmoniae]
MAIANEAARTGAGQRTIMVATRRQPRVLILRLGSNRPNRPPTAIAAGPSVSATATPTKMPTAQGTPRVWKYGIRVKLRQYVAPAMVRPEPRITWAVPWNMV